MGTRQGVFISPILFTFFLWILHINEHHLYNIYTEQAVIYQGPSGSHFGYALKIIFNEEHHSQLWILVGAPQSNSTCGDEGDLLQPGALYKCGVDETTCAQVCVDMQGNTRAGGSRGYRENRENQRLGTSLDATHNDDQITVCGPLWQDNKFRDRSHINGMCYEIDTTWDIAGSRRLLPLYNPRKQLFNDSFLFAYGTAGMSTHYSYDGSLILGAPGILNWQGGYISYPGESRHTPNIVYTFDNSTDYSYAGYSVTSGHLYSEQESCVIVSAPRTNLRGKVAIFQSDVLVAELDGDQDGSYFGYTVVTVDLDNDQIDELLVSAPMYSDEHHLDQGMVAVYSNGKLIETLRGSFTSNARFGMAIAGPPYDLDNDGYNDIIIGAPYENDGSGAVYVYNGGQLGVSPFYTQRISPLTHGWGVTGFGFAISELNGRIAVSALSSNQVVLLSTRTVLNVDMTMAFDPSDHIDLNNHNCFDSTKTCLAIDIALSYSGTNVPDNADFQCNLTVDSQRTGILTPPRGGVIIDDAINTTVINIITLARNERFADTFIVVLNELKWRDYLTDFTVTLAYHLHIPSDHLSSDHTPVIHKDSDRPLEKSIPFLHTCSFGLECVCDLQLSSSIFTTLSDQKTALSDSCLEYNSDSYVYVQTMVVNAADEAYGVHVVINHSSHLYFVHVEPVNNGYVPYCTPQHHHSDNLQTEDSREVICYLYQDLTSGTTIEYNVVFKMVDFTNSKPILDFTISANSENKEHNITLADNKIQTSVCIEPKILPTITGISLPYKIDAEQLKEQSYSSNTTTDDVTNGTYTPTVIRHTYILSNSDPWAITNTSVLLTVYNYTDAPTAGDDQNVFQIYYTAIVNSTFQETEGVCRQLIRSHTAHCSSVACVMYNCSLDVIAHNDKFTLEVKYSMNLKSLLIHHNEYVIQLKSKASWVTLSDTVIAENHITTDIILHKPELKIWMIFVAVICGILLYIMIVLIFYQLGFFCRPYKEQYEQLLHDHKVVDEPASFQSTHPGPLVLDTDVQPLGRRHLHPLHEEVELPATSPVYLTNHLTDPYILNRHGSSPRLPRRTHSLRSTPSEDGSPSPPRASGSPSGSTPGYNRFVSMESTDGYMVPLVSNDRVAGQYDKLNKKH